MWETNFYTPPVLGGAALLPFSAPAVYKTSLPGGAKGRCRPRGSVSIENRERGVFEEEDVWGVGGQIFFFQGQNSHEVFLPALKQEKKTMQ